MKAITIFLVLGTAMMLGVCATVTATMANPNPALNDQSQSQVRIETKGNMNAESVLSLKKGVSACPVTRTIEAGFVPPAPYPAVAPYGEFWYGTEKLWTMLIPGGRWHALPNDGAGFGQKVFWWRNGYDPKGEPIHALKVTGRQLNGDGTFTGMEATNAFHEDFGGWAMLIGVEIPSAGCWEITGEYGGERLSFVVEVGE